jgi:CheY-like chemotaxis protein
MRVLVAEDTPISAEAMKVMAAQLSFEMDIAANGLEAIDMVLAAEEEGRPYALMLTDVMMPILDGMEATSRLRERGFTAEKLPIIAVTAATSFDEVRSYKACGMQAFLAKPFSLEELRAAMDAWAKKASSKEPAAKPAIDPALADVFKGQFLERNRHTQQLIVRALESEEISAETADEIHNLLHQIAGTATLFGLGELSEQARRHEHDLGKAWGSPDKIRACFAEAARDLGRWIEP